METLADLWYESHGTVRGRDNHYNDSRCHMLNLHASFTKGSIEFRLFQFNNPSENSKGGINCNKMKAYIQLCLAMSELAKRLKYASPTPQQTET